MRLSRAFPCALLLHAFAALALLTGCGEPCVDADGDGYGAGCAAGLDCDDTLATRALDCEDPLPDCERDEFTPGCACRAGTRRECYAGPEETLDVAGCHSGYQQCPTGSWGACEDVVLPIAELCNDVDDDCDGRSDEGVRSPCGECDAECKGGVWGEGEAPFVAGDGFELGPRGELMLARHPVTTSSVFVPNTGEGTVSAIDPDSAIERARYRVSDPHPEQIAVDYQGNAWLLDGSSTPARLSQIAGEAASCIDRAGDGIDTSSGPDDLLALGEDDCVLRELTVDAYEAAGAVSALAIGGQRAPDEDGAPVLWIGLPDDEAMLALHGVTGEVLARVETPGVRAHAAAIDPWGTLWVLDRSGMLAAIGPGTDAPSVEIITAPLACYVLESLAIDVRGVLSLTGGECESIVVYDPMRDHWSYVKTPGVLDARGVAALSLGDSTRESSDSESWVTHAAGRITRVAHDPLELKQTYSLAGEGVQPFDSGAVSDDALGRLWIVSSGGGSDQRGLLTRFDVDTGRVSAQITLGYLPRAQGDFTGQHRFATIEPEGVASYMFEGCNQGRASADPAQGGASTQWLAVHVAGVVSDGSEVSVEARHAQEHAELRDADFELLGTLPADTSPYALELAAGGLVEVRLTARSTDYLGGPRITRVGLEWQCPGPD